MDLVLTDLEMPEMNGLDLILELIRTFLNVKVIAMSGLSTEKLQTARLLEARQTFAKPLNLPELLHAIEYEILH